MSTSTMSFASFGRTGEHWERGGMNPRRRTLELVVQDEGRETVIFDDVHQHFHTLNETAAAVWRMADGATSPDEMAIRIGMPRDVVDLALARLVESELVEGTVVAGMDRRAVIKKLALAGFAGAAVLPAVSSISVSAAPPVSCRPLGAPCTIGQCCAPYTCFAGTCQLPPP